jgi:hypothetical protein
MARGIAVPLCAPKHPSPRAREVPLLESWAVTTTRGTSNTSQGSETELVPRQR